jgi:hypothetical protein
MSVLDGSTLMKVHSACSSDLMLSGPMSALGSVEQDDRWLRAKYSQPGWMVEGGLKGCAEDYGNLLSPHNPSSAPNWEKGVSLQTTSDTFSTLELI